MNTAVKGRRSEHRARKFLEQAGYQVVRAAASKGPADLVAWDRMGFRFISVKSGTKYLSAVEREQLEALVRPTNSTVECWRFPDRARSPLIEVL